jgi:hypothetical protein
LAGSGASRPGGTERCALNGVVGELGAAFGEDGLTICVLVVAGCSPGGATPLNCAGATALHALSRRLRRLVVPVERPTHLGPPGTAVSESQNNAFRKRPTSIRTVRPTRPSLHSAWILIDTPRDSAIDFPLVRNGFRLSETWATAT